MKFELLLLFALLGPFCTITHAMPTEITLSIQDKTVPDLLIATHATESDVQTTEPVANTEAPTEKTEANTKTLPVDTETLLANTVEEKAASSSYTELPTQETETETAVITIKTLLVNTDETVTEKETVVTGASSQIPQTQKEFPETTDFMTYTDQAAGQNTEEEREVEVEDSGVLGTGQVICIVIGALVAVGIIIAVIVVAVWRMGQYSP